MATNSFRQMISAGIIKRSDNGMFIKLEHLHIKPDFNKRTDGERLDEANEETYLYAKSGGKFPALEVKARDEGGVWVVEGHRRTKVFNRLDAEGLFPRVPSKDDPKVTDAWVAISQFTGNDVDSVARIWTSNNQLDLTMYEQAMVVKELDGFNLSPIEIAAKVSKKRQHIDFLLIIVRAPHAVQMLIKSGQVSADVAVEIVRKHGDKAVDILNAEVEKAEAQGKAKVTKGTVIGRALPRSVIEDMTGLVKRVVKDLPLETKATLEKYRAGEITDANQMVTVSVRDLLGLTMCSDNISEIQAKNDQKAKEAAEAAAAAAQVAEQVDG